MANFLPTLTDIVKSWKQLKSFSPENLDCDVSQFCGEIWTEGMWNSTASALIIKDGPYLRFIKETQKKINVEVLSPPIPRIEHS
jgi:hypothetical protein